MSRKNFVKSIAFGLILATSLLADDNDTEPGRPVARISLTQGDVTVRRGDSGDWVAAVPNAPLLVPDRLVTGPSSRAEMQLDYSNFARIAADSELRLSELEDGRYGIQLAAGTMTYRVLRDLEAEIEISTPSVAIRPLKKGTYRISVSPDGTTEVTVRSGEVEIFSPRGAERLRSGRTMLVRGTIEDPEFQFVAQIADDEWDQWNVRRDRELEKSTAYRYVSTSIYGAEDLDAHGTWVYDAPYGNVWVPAVSVGWAPYRFGRWTWIDWYGWSWVSYDPWGWAPYHYGRWYQGSRGWAWYPGGVRERHRWTPGQVAWIGFGGNSGYRTGIGIGWGNVGWVPLAPHEPFHPWYGSRYYRGGNINRNTTNINIVNNVNIHNVYRNARGGNGVTGVSSNDFVNGRGGGYVRVGENDIRAAAVSRGQLPLTPDRGSQRLGDREVAGAPRASAREDGRFYSRRNPARTDRVSFDDQRRSIDETARRSFPDQPDSGRREAAGGPVPSGRGTEQRVVEERTTDINARNARQESGRSADPSSAVSPNALPPKSPASDQQSGGWRRFGEPRGTEGGGASTRTERRAKPAEGGNSGANEPNGWRRLGDNGSGSGQPSERRDNGIRSRARESQPSGSTIEGRGRTGDAPRSRDNGSWQRSPDSAPPARTDRSGGFGSRSESPRSVEPRNPAPPRQEAPRMERQTPPGGGQPVRVDPPVVRERRGQEFQSRDRRGEERNGGFGQPRPSRGNFGGDSGDSGGGSPRMNSGGDRGFSTGGVIRSVSGEGSSPRGSRGRR